MERPATETFPPGEGVDAIILVGGRGTRLQSVVNDRPKPMALVNGRPFLTYLLDQLLDARVSRVILASGHKSGVIEQELGSSYKGLELVHSVEQEPLGTGGALRHCLPLVQNPNVLVMNGDSYVELKLADFFGFARSVGEPAIVAVRVDNAGRFGELELDDEQRIARFHEKNPASEGKPGWINAGIYALAREYIEQLPDSTPLSLEREVFMAEQRDVKANPLFAYRCEGAFIDIGVPEEYERAQSFFAPHG